MLSLTKKNKNIVCYKGMDIAINLFFDTVLKCYEIEANEALDNVSKVVLFAELLIADLDQYENVLDISDLAEIIKLAFEKISIAKVEQDGEASASEPLYNYVEDAERIYASFKSAYNMDLIKEQGKLDWIEFIALFNNLPHESPIMQAIYYRGCDIPRGIDKEERKRIQKLKRYYELSYQRKKREESMLKAMQEQLEGAKA